MAHLFEVKAVRNRIQATKWKITSKEYIDIDIYVIVNPLIKTFELVATSIQEEDIFIYEVKFYRSHEHCTVQRMFPGCNVEPIPVTHYGRIYVVYDREHNCYRPFDDPSM